MKRIINQIQNRLSSSERTYYNALLNVSARALQSVRDLLLLHQYVELAEGSLYPLTGVARNPLAALLHEEAPTDRAWFSSAQLQLDALALQLGKNCFTVTQTFEAGSSFFSRLANNDQFSQSVLVEIEALYPHSEVASAFDKLLFTAEHLVKYACTELLQTSISELFVLNPNLALIRSLPSRTFVRLSYQEACEVLGKKGGRIASAEIPRLLRHFGRTPIFITGFPADSQPFHVKCADGRAWNFALYLPGTDAVICGALFEEAPDKVKAALLNQFPGYGQASVPDATARSFETYLDSLTAADSPRRGGLVLSFDKLLGALITSVEDGSKFPVPLGALQSPTLGARTPRRT